MKLRYKLILAQSCNFIDVVNVKFVKYMCVLHKSTAGILSIEFCEKIKNKRIRFHPSRVTGWQFRCRSPYVRGWGRFMPVLVMKYMLVMVSIRRRRIVAIVTIQRMKMIWVWLGFVTGILVNITGNPRVLLAVPVPVPAETHTRWRGYRYLSG